MAGQKPGPLCSSQLCPDWIDAGTLSRSRTGPPGPLGVAPSQIVAAAPQAQKVQPEKKEEIPPDEKALIEDNIQRIARSPFGRTPEGREIARKLRQLHDGDKIKYGETGEEVRGDWDGTEIRINRDFKGNMCKTIPTLVHEASHAVWRAKHPIAKNKPPSPDEEIDNEVYAQVNELKIYKWLKDEVKLCILGDFELDERLRRQERGTLRTAIKANMENNKTYHSTPPP